MFQWPSFIRTPPRRSRRSQDHCEVLECRQLLTTDLSLGAASISGVSLTDNGFGNHYVSVSISFDIINSGTTAIDLANGTPGDFSDDPQIEVAPSVDNLFDGGDTPFITVSAALGQSNTIIQPGQTRSFAANGTFFQQVSISSIVARIDHNGVVTEDDETNNSTFAGVARPIMSNSANVQPVLKRQLGVVDPNAGFFDGNSLIFNGGEIHAVIGSPQSHDKLKIIKSGSGQDRLKVSGINLMLGKTVLGTVLGNGTPNLTIQLTSTNPNLLTLLRVQRVLRSIGFKGSEDNPTQRSVSFQVIDPLTNASNIDHKVVQFA